MASGFKTWLTHKDSLRPRSGQASRPKPVPKNKSRQQKEVGIQFKLGWPTRTRTLNDGTKNRSVANYTMGQSLLTTLF